MGVLEIVLLIIGGAIFVLSFVLPKTKEGMDAETRKFVKEQVRVLIDRELEIVQSKIEDMVSETIEESASETDRTLKKITNEKMMAISEYSNTVLEDINKNHKEVLFLYDMLNDKHTTIKNAVSEVEKTVGEVTQTAKDIEISARETAKEAKNSEEAAKRAADIANRVEKAAEIIQEKTEEKQEKVFSVGNLRTEAETDEVAAISGKVSENDEFGRTESSIESKRNRELKAVDRTAEKGQKEPEDEFVEGITAGVPKVVFDGEDEENPQYHIIEPSDAQNSNERILELHKEGMSAVAIAKELGLGIGEVKLVIDLFEGTSR